MNRQNKNWGNQLAACIFLFTSLLASAISGAQQSNSDANADVITDANQVTTYYRQDTNQNPAPLTIPSHWKAHTLREPVWQSNVYVVEAGLDKEQSIILIHGLNSIGLQDWQQLIPKLAEDYHVIAFDLPGFARSGKPAAKYSPENYAKVVAYIVQELAHGPVIPVGHSMGGAIALEYSARYPYQVKRVVLASVAGILERRALMENASEVSIDASGLPGPLGILATKVGQIGRRVVEWTSVVPDVSNLLDAADPIWIRVFGNYPFTNAAYALSLHDFTQSLALLEKPVTIIWGSNDPIAPIRTGKLLNEKISDSEFIVIPGAKHGPMHSHAGMFERYVRQGIEGIRNPSMPTIPQAFQGSIHCQNQHNVHYSGRYKEIILENCQNIQLQDVVAERIVFRHALAYLDNVNVHSEKQTAIEIHSSFVSATNSNFSGPTAVYANDGRLDFANVTLTSPKRALRFEKKSRVVASLSRIDSKVYQGSLHGLFINQYFWIDDQVMRRR